MRATKDICEAHIAALLIHQILFPNIVTHFQPCHAWGKVFSFALYPEQSNCSDHILPHPSNTNLFFDDPRMTQESSMDVAILICSNTLLEGPWIKLSIGSISSQIRYSLTILVQIKWIPDSPTLQLAMRRIEPRYLCTMQGQVRQLEYLGTLCVLHVLEVANIAITACW